MIKSLSKYPARYVLFIWFAINASACVQHHQAEPAEVAIGERLFLETRFAQAWYAKPGKAEPALEYTLTKTEPMRGAFAGKTMNCRVCHMVDEHAMDKHGGMRSYADFSHRSLVPQREDGQYVATRNSMSLVNISTPRDVEAVFHFDGEFNSMQDLVIGTLTDRNYGWLHTEKSLAIKHIAKVIREDDGKGKLAKEFGGSYRKILLGTDPDIKAEFRLSAEYRVDTTKASDAEIVAAIAKLIAVYVTDLRFSRDDKGKYNASPYDLFLRKNNLPGKPDSDESTAAYSQRLLMLLGKIKLPQFVSASDGKFATHQQSFVFGNKELEGMQLFFRKANQQQRAGNCVACHSAPDFSDFGFHNTGLTQVVYDEAHGEGNFMALDIPKLKVRNKNYRQYLPATSIYPEATGRFRSVINQDRPGIVDLGLWNVFANPQMPGPQKKLKAIICRQANRLTDVSCREEVLLPLTIAAFKTPVIRDLGHSAPYMHGGQFTNLKEAIGFYITSSSLAKAGKLRNAAPELLHVNLIPTDVDALVAFVKALNEDYD